MNEYFLNGKSVSFEWITAQAQKAKISTDEFIKKNNITQSSTKPKQNNGGVGEIPSFGQITEPKKVKEKPKDFFTKENLDKLTYDITSKPKENKQPLFTEEYKADKAKKEYEQAIFKKETDAKSVLNLKKAVVRNNPDLKEAKEIFDYAQNVDDDFKISLEEEVASEMQKDGMIIESSGGSGQYSISDASSKPAYVAFSDERKQIIAEGAKQGKKYDDSELLRLSTELYKKKKTDERIYAQTFDAMESIESLGDDVMEFMKDYKLAEKNAVDARKAKIEVNKEFTKKTIESAVEKDKKLASELKPEGYKYTSQEEIDKQNSIIKEINDNRNLIRNSASYHDKLTDDSINLEGDSLGLAESIELYNKEWGWWSRSGLKTAQALGQFGGGLAGGAAWLLDNNPLSIIANFGSTTQIGDFVAEMKKTNEDLYGSLLPEQRDSFSSIEAFSENAATSVLNMVPLIATTVVAPEAWAPEIITAITGFTTGIGEKYTGMLNEQKYGTYNKQGDKYIPKYNTLQLFAVPALFGTAEAGTEYFGGRAIGRAFKGMGKLINKATPAELAVIEYGINKTAKAKAQNFASAVLQNYGEEIPTEQINNVLGNFYDKYLLGKKDVELTDNAGDVLFDTVVVSSFFGSAPTVAGAVYRPFMRPSDVQTLVDNNNKISSLLANLDYENISVEEKAIIDKQISAIKDNSSSIINNIAGMIGSQSKEDILAIDKSSKGIIELNKQIAVIRNSSTLSDTQKAEALNTLQKQSEDLTRDYSTRLNKAYAYEQQARKVKSFFGSKLKREITADVKKGAAFISKVLLEDPSTTIKFKSGKELVDLMLADTEKYKVIKKQAEAIEADDVANGAEKYTAEQKAFTERAIASDSVNANGFYDAATGIVYINKTNVLRDKVKTTARHEILHKLIQPFANNMAALGSSLYDYVKANSTNPNFKDTDFYKRNQLYKENLDNKLEQQDQFYKKELDRLKIAKETGAITEAEYNSTVAEITKNNEKAIEELNNNSYEEVLTILSESLENKDITINPEIDINVNLNRDGNVVLNNASDVFNFIAQYNESFTNASATGAIKSAAEGKVTGELLTSTNKNQSVSIKKSLSPQQVQDKVDKINEKIDELDDIWANGGIDDKAYYAKVEAFEKEIDALENPSIETKVKKEEIKRPVKLESKEVNLEDEAKEVIKENKGKVASEKVQAAYNAKGVEGAMAIIDLFKPITKALVDKRREAPGFDRELLTDEIETGKGGILDLIQKYDPKGGVPLAAYINKYLPVRAITASRRVLDKEFSKDVEDQKGLMSSETAEQSFDNNTEDKPKYKSLLEQNIIEPSFVESIRTKALATLRTLKERIDTPVSINRTITPIIAEIKDAMGKQADIDLKTAMGGKKDNQFRSWLLKNKKATLENMTTTWLMGANGVGGIPQAIQKKIDGKWVNYPEWVGKKIDRESVNTDLAGRTSGAELVRRLPNAVNNVSDADYLGQFLEPSGNPIRGRKESLAKATAEELSFDIIKEDFANEGELFSAFTTNQERQGVEVKEVIKTDFVKQVERGNVKFSLSSKAKIDFENKTNEFFDNINLKNNITKKGIEFAVNKTFKEWNVEDKKELIDKFTVYLRSAVQTIGRNFRNKGKKYEVKVRESIKAFTEANDDGSAISVRLQTVKPVSENFKNPQHLKDLQEINRDFGVDLLSKFGQKRGLELLASFWYPSVAGRSSEGSKSIFKGSDSFKAFLKDIQEGYKNIIPFESIDISRKSNSVSQDMMLGSISTKQKAIDNKMSNDAWDFTVFAVESFANKVKDNDNGFTNDHLASLLTSLIYERNSALRSAAPVAGILMDSRIKDPKKYDYDHSKPSRYVLSRLMDKFVDNKEVDLSDVKKDYVVTVIPKALSNKLTKAGLRSMMPYYYKEGEGVQTRLKYATENLENTVKFSKSDTNYAMPDETLLHHGGTIKNISDIKTPFYFATDKNQAGLYAKGSQGKVNSFVIKSKEIVEEDVVFSEINKLGLKSKDTNYEIDELNLYELIDPNFDTSLSEKDLDLLFNSLGKKGIKAVRFLDMNLDTLKNDIENIVVLDKSIIKEPIKFSKTINDAFNQIIEDRFGIEEYKRFSAVVGKRRGAKKGKYRVFIPPSAEDFMGLLYDFLGKGKEGEATKKWFDEVFMDPYRAGILSIETAKQSIKRSYTQLLKDNKEIAKKLRKKTPDGDYTYDQAIRVFLWTKAGYSVPGLTERDTKKLNELINGDDTLLSFANSLSVMSQQEKGWTEPGDYWDTETLLSDLANLTEGKSRKEYLQEFIQNANVVFSEENMNKIRAALGNNWVEAMEDSLYRMKNGTNRPSGSNRIVNSWNNWVNNSTGAIMFFNRRSATLQLISATNFLNWSDNNPIKAATAFANQPQYWKDFVTLFNSDKLKERRSGLKTEVSEAEIANAVNSASNKAKAAMSYLLKIGFTPTQIADSMAIAGGGSTFYRNRINTYLKEVDVNGNKKYSQEAAEAKAFEDFSKTSDESQQSSDPSLVSMQQASSLGRLVLAFQNTPQQYMRLTKKAARDLINGRGDWKTNVSKIVYYTTVQNLVFSALQSALFATLPGFDDDEEEESVLEKKKDDKIFRIINSMTDTVLKGSGLYGAIISTLKNIAMEYSKQEEKGYKADHAETVLQAASISPPMGSKLRKLYSATKTARFEKDVIAERGWSATIDGKVNLSPKYALAGSIASGFANIPLDRIVDEVNSLSEALDDRNTKFQRIALGLGWKTWDVGAENEENDLIKEKAKGVRKEEGIEKAKITRKASYAKTKQENIAKKRKRRERAKTFTEAEKDAYANMNSVERKAYWEKFDKQQANEKD
jgi:hypothetical protein